MTLVGTLLGGIPGIASSIEGIMLVVIAVSMLPMAVPVLRRRLASRRMAREADAALAVWSAEPGSASASVSTEHGSDGAAAVRSQRTAPAPVGSRSAAL